MWTDAIDEILKSKGNKLDADNNLRVIDGAQVLTKYVVQKVEDYMTYMKLFYSTKEDKSNKIEKEVRQEIQAMIKSFDEIEKTHFPVKVKKTKRSPSPNKKNKSPPKKTKKTMDEVKTATLNASTNTNLLKILDEVEPKIKESKQEVDKLSQIDT